MKCQALFFKIDWWLVGLGTDSYVSVPECRRYRKVVGHRPFKLVEVEAAVPVECLFTGEFRDRLPCLSDSFQNVRSEKYMASHFSLISYCMMPSRNYCSLGTGFFRLSRFDNKLTRIEIWTGYAVNVSDIADICYSPQSPAYQKCCDMMFISSAS